MTELQVLGPVEAIGKDGPLNLGGPKQRRLLAVLIVNANSIVPTERLMDVLWDGDLPAGARRSFKAYVARLRMALAADGAEGLIVTHPSGYALEIGRDFLDATRFEEMIDRARAELALGEIETTLSLVNEALASWRGPAFGEFAGEEWAEAWVARLDSTRIAAHELRIEAELAFGRHAELLPEIDELIARFPYSDRLRGQRMTALYRSGRQVDALRDFQQYRNMLANEVGVEPGAELVALEQQIVSQDGDLLASQPVTRMLRDYELGERVGADSFAVVYRGSQPSVGREVAVKVIRPELANRPEFIHRFEAEAQLVASIEHPHVVPLYDFWREPGGAYLVMRWLGGGSLRERLEQTGAMTIAAVARVAEQVGGALAVAHRAGIVQCDLRPDHVMFDDLGNAYLTDFGIALRSLNDDDPSASTAYTSPERLARGLASARSDVYSLGAVLFEALVGRPPSDASDRWPSELIRPDIPPAFDGVVRKACAADPADRFYDMAEFVVVVRATSGLEAGSSAVVGDRLAGARVDYLNDETERVNPYKGLRAFGEGDTKDFFGRDQLISELVENLDRTRFIAVVGPSGSGKSSLIRAGVVPRLHDDGVFVATMVPGARPFDELERALLRISPHADPALTARLTGSSNGIAQAVRSILGSSGRMLLVIDQFEELFTITTAPLRDRFLDGLAELVDDDSNQVRVVVTVRADFYDRPLLHPRIGPLVRDNTRAVTPLDATELELAITGPARRVGVEFEPALVADLVADAATNPGTLPLLQYVLTELYANRAARLVTASEYQAMGRMSGTLATRADGLFADLGESNSAAVRRLFTQLVTPGEGTEDTRRRTSVSELAGVPEIVLEVYSRARLITFDRDPVTREPTVEVAHEALIREWPRMRTWVDDDRDDLRVLNHLAATARTWVERGRDSDELYRGARLAGAVDIKSSHSEHLGPLASEFLTASIDVADTDSRRLRRTIRRLRSLLVAAAISLLLALAAGSFAVVRSQEASGRARAAELGSLLSASAASLESDPQLATLLAFEATRFGDDGDSALFAALTNDPRRVATILPRTGQLTEMTMSGNGSTIVVTNGTSLEVLDLEGLIHLGEVHEDVIDSPLFDLLRLAISADGATVAAIRFSNAINLVGEVTLIDVSTGEQSPGPLVPAANVMFSPTEDVLVIGSRGDFDAETRVWQGEAPPVALPALFPRAFSGDGRWLGITEIPPTSVTVVRPDDPSDDASWKRVPTNQSDLGVMVSVLLDFTGERLVVQRSNGITIHDVSTREMSHAVEIPGVTDIAISPAGQVAASDVTGVVQLYDIDTGASVGRPYFVRPGANGVKVAFRPDGTLVTGGQVVILWSTSSMSSLSQSTVGGDYGARFSPDGSLIATTDRSGNLFIHRVLDGELLVEADIARNGNRISATPMVFSADGKMLVVAGGTGSDNLSGFGAFGVGLIQVFDAATGDLLNQVSLSAGPEPTAIDLSPDGTNLAVGYRGGELEVRNFPAIEERLILNTEILIESVTGARLGQSDILVRGVAFAADGQSFLAVADVTNVGSINGFEAVQRWSATTGEPLPWRINSFGAGRNLTVLADRRIVTSSAGGGITVHDASGDEVLFELFGHSGSITAMVAAGTLLATASSDGTVRLWDLERQEAFGPSIATTGGFVDLSDDGRWLAIAGDSGISIWSLDPTDWAESACQIAGRNLTRAEWDRYLPSGEPYHGTCPQWNAVD